MRQHQRPPLLCKSMLKKVTCDLFFSMKRNANAYIPMFYPTTNQVSDHDSVFIIDISDKRLLPHAISLIAIKNILYWNIIKTRMTAYTQTLIPPTSKELTSILIAIKNQTQLYKTQVPLNTLQRTFSIHCYSIITNKPQNRECYSIYLILNNV